MKKLLSFVLFASISIFFNIPSHAVEHGTADEAVALTKKAITYYKSKGREVAVADLNNPKGQFVNKDLYVLLAEESGLVLANANNSKMIGKNLRGLKDVNGVEISEKILAVAKSKEGKGWVDYMWPNPLTQQVEKKSTYVERDGDLMFMCGIYK